jgi:hypothetical protein
VDAIDGGRGEAEVAEKPLLIAFERHFFFDFAESGIPEGSREHLNVECLPVAVEHVRVVHVPANAYRQPPMQATLAAGRAAPVAEDFALASGGWSRCMRWRWDSSVSAVGRGRKDQSAMSAIRSRGMSVAGVKASVKTQHWWAGRQRRDSVGSGMESFRGVGQSRHTIGIQNSD